MSNIVSVEIGEMPDSFVGRYGNRVQVNNKNIGLNFYTIDWPPQEPGVVKIDVGGSSVEIDFALVLSSNFDRTFPDEGIYGLDIGSGLTKKETMPHDEARLKFYDLLSRMLKAGWKRYIYQAHARLSGAEALRHALADPLLTDSQDPGYVPSLEDWMKLRDNTLWELYKDGVYMEIRFMRDHDRMKLDEPGAYAVSVSIEAFDSKWRTLLPEKDRPRWRELLRKQREEEQADRQATEDKLRAEGYKIDTDYRNPDEGVINPPKPTPQKSSAAKPAVPDVRAATGQPCPVSGLWECREHGVSQQLHISAMQTMPQATLPAPRSTWQKLRGEQPIFTTTAVWRLARPDASDTSTGTSHE